LTDLALGLRAATDFDVVDELLIADDVLSLAQHNLMIWLSGSITYNSTLQQLMQWVTNSGGIFNAGSDVNALLNFCMSQWKHLDNSGNTFPANPLPPTVGIDWVFVSYYLEGILLFNNQAVPANKTVSIPYASNTQWRVAYPLVPVGWSQSVSLQPFQMIFLDGGSTSMTSGASSSTRSKFLCCFWTLACLAFTLYCV